jgi:REP element-mobilizing transposase RayT
MARHGRYFLPDQPLHVIQRGNNRSAIFFDIEDYEHTVTGSPEQLSNTVV